MAPSKMPFAQKQQFFNNYKKTKTKKDETQLKNVELRIRF